MKNLLFITIAMFGLVTITNGQTIPSYVPTNGLIGWWPFNGNADDESGNGHNGIVNGATLTTDRNGLTNAAYLIDGIDCGSLKGITTPVSIDNTVDYSITLWFQGNDSTKAFQTILNSIPHNFISMSMYYNGTLPLCSWIGDGSNWIIDGTTNNWSFTDNNNWHHAALIKNEKSIKYFIDGVQVRTQNIHSSISAGSFSLNFGAISISGPVHCYEVFLGKLDDIGIWNRTLTQQEITNLYQGVNVDVNTSVDAELFSVYPNPVNTQLKVQVDPSLMGSVCQVFDNTSKLVLNSKINAKNTVIKFDGLPEGVYFLRIGKYLRKIFKVATE